jgi:hypothetical protein
LPRAVPGPWASSYLCLGMARHAQFVCWDGVLLTFCLGWLQTMILTSLILT